MQPIGRTSLIATLADMAHQIPQIARLALEDGTVFQGSGFGACSPSDIALGEVVFTTAMCGYQEALSDPSFSGQILVMTPTEIGNYGVNDEDVESASRKSLGLSFANFQDGVPTIAPRKT